MLQIKTYDRNYMKIKDQNLMLFHRYINRKIIFYLLLNKYSNGKIIFIYY